VFDSHAESHKTPGPWLSHPPRARGPRPRRPRHPAARSLQHL